MTEGPLDFPLHIGAAGCVATTDGDDHVRDMVQQVLFTAPGERVNRPDFGCGLLELAFEPNSDVLAAALELRVRSSLQRWLSDVIEVDQVRLDHEDARLVVDIEYTRKLNGQQMTERFVAALPGEAAG
jgi:phage baseplate assembly protein W